MVQRIGTRRKSRYKLKKGLRQKGKLSMVQYFQKFENGERVILKADPSVHEGMFFHRFYGMSGTIAGTQGKCYRVKIIDGRKEKILVVHPIHLQKR